MHNLNKQRDIHNLLCTIFLILYLNFLSRKFHNFDKLGLKKRLLQQIKNLNNPKN